MNKLRRLSKIFAWAAIVTFVVAFFVLMQASTPGSMIFPSIEAMSVCLYILVMIPVLFASLAASLKFIAKAIDPD